MRKPVKKIRLEIEPDNKYASLLVTRLINKILQQGKKTIASRIVYQALAQAEQATKKPALEVFEKAVENAAPQLELRSRRVGGANYQVPHEVRNDRRITLALRWLVMAAKKQKGKKMSVKLAEEIVNAFHNTGAAVKRKQDTHRMAEANRAFAHFAW